MGMIRKILMHLLHGYVFWASIMPVIYTLGQMENVISTIVSAAVVENVMLMTDGKEYHTKQSLSCPFHSLAFEIECSNRAQKAAQIIHLELGRGHSNYPEASHNVLTRFGSKDKNLQCEHYTVSTNLRLLQAGFIRSVVAHTIGSQNCTND